jgi:hypothetical protein
VWRQAQFILKFKNKEGEVQANAIRVHRFLKDNETKRIYMDALVPPRDSWSYLEIYFWNGLGEKELFIDNLEVVTFND